MTPDDERELYRLTDMLAKIDETLPIASPLREALQKAGLSLSLAFDDGRRCEIDGSYANLGGELTPQQRQHLESLGLEPDDHD